VTEKEWLTCTDPTPMLAFVRGKASDRQLRLFACACCRTSWSFLTDIRTREAVEASEQYADNLIKRRELRRAEVRASNVHNIRYSQRSQLARSTANVPALVLADLPWLVKNEIAVGLLRDIFGNLFRSSSRIPPAVLKWNYGTVRRIAEGIYEERRLSEGTLDTGRLSILADALLDAGCEDEALMEHCRSEGPHVRGCWAIDLILGKE